ncbi:MAG TPA: hypothetical protein VE991_11010, partial [Acidimicrobiales bacterium]|nr:hypothetical protein [Acidimicrobiales bacterium]
EFAPHAADTRAADVCAVSRHPNTVPSPERLAGAMVLNNGAITLDPPRASAQAVVSAASIRKKDLDRAAFERLRLILALYSAKLPARQEPDGSLVPLYQDVLSWVVYSVPRSPNISGCGGWGVQVFDATSGEPIIASGWAPGP